MFFLDFLRFFCCPLRDDYDRGMTLMWYVNAGVIKWIDIAVAVFEISMGHQHLIIDT